MQGEYPINARAVNTVERPGARAQPGGGDLRSLAIDVGGCDHGGPPDLDRVLRGDRRHAGRRPAPGEPAGRIVEPVDPCLGRLEPRVDARRRSAFGVVYLVWRGPRARRRVPDRLRARAQPVARQPVRLRHALRLLRRAERGPAQGAVLRHRRRDRPARRCSSCRRRAARRVPLDALRVRRPARRHRRSRMARARRRARSHPDRNPVLRVVRRRGADDRRLRRRPHLHRAATAGALATPLFAALVLVATFDVIFAVDSIPAIFASRATRSSSSPPTRSRCWA